MIDGDVRAFLAVFGVVGIVYVWFGSGMWKKSNSDWWGELSQPKKIIFVLAIAATAAQMLL